MNERRKKIERTLKENVGSDVESMARENVGSTAREFVERTHEKHGE